MTYIKLYRELLDSQCFTHPITLKIWIWLLIKAKYKDGFVPLKSGRGFTEVEIKRGQFVFGRFKAEAELFIDGSTIYKHLQKLEEWGQISIESNNQYSVITICKYDDYQDKIELEEQPSNNQVTTKEQPSNTVKESKELKEKEKMSSIAIRNRRKRFKIFINWFNKIRGTNYTAKNQKVKEKFLARIKDGYDGKDFKTTLNSLMNQQNHKETNFRYITPEFICRQDILEREKNSPTEISENKILTPEEIAREKENAFLARL